MVGESTAQGIEVGYPGAISGAGVPKQLSTNAFQICRAEWSWSPAHSRDDSYALHSGRNDWFLWLSFYDDSQGKIDHNVIGRMPKNGLDAESAAKTLLKAFWQFDKKEGDVDRPHYCSAGALSDAVLDEVMSSVWGIETGIPYDLVKAYESTDFRVLEPHSFTLRVGRHSPELAALYNDMGVSSAGYLTAWNPYSAETSDEDNKRSQEALLRKLSLEGFPSLGALGEDPSGEWPGEDSVFVPGISLERAQSLGVEFGQNAILWAGDDAVPQLILLR